MACNAFYQIDTRIQLWEAGYRRLRGTQNIFVAEYLFTTGSEIAIVRGRTKEAASAASVPATDRACGGRLVIEASPIFSMHVFQGAGLHPVGEFRDIASPDS
jgi:hypothetical protein